MWPWEASGHTARARPKSTRLVCGRGKALRSEPRRVGVGGLLGNSLHAGMEGCAAASNSPSCGCNHRHSIIASDEREFREVPTSAFAGLGRPEMERTGRQQPGVGN